MKSTRTAVIAEIGLAIALAAVLKFLAIRLPINIAGGSISLDMLPLVVVALRRGILPGVAVGILFGLVDLMLEPYVVHPIQMLLDYPVAHGLVGFAGVGARTVISRLSEQESASALIHSAFWILVGVLARFGAAFVSGMVFFAANAPAGQPVALYSAAYNASYLAPSAVAVAIAYAAVAPALHRAVPVAPVAPARAGSVGA